MWRVLAVSALCLVASPRTAAAEWQLTPMVGLTFLGNTTFVDVERATGKVHIDYGGSVALLGGGILGVEGLFVSTPHFFEQGDANLVTSSRSFALMGNVVVTAPRRWTEYSLRPFVSGGLGLMRASVVDVLDVHANLFSYNVGGGAIGFFTPRTGIRFDVRYYSSLHGSERSVESFGPVHLRYVIASVGIVFRR